ncbi:C6 finger domain-containing protein, variant [Homalodisca vitripennis]|nr:C6 finger domain-containing protein, variant [Homalodisca vitripennis]
MENDAVLDALDYHPQRVGHLSVLSVVPNYQPLFGEQALGGTAATLVFCLFDKGSSTNQQENSVQIVHIEAARWCGPLCSVVVDYNKEIHRVPYIYGRSSEGSADENFMKNGTNEWTFTRERVKVTNTSYIIKNLEPDTSYKVKLNAANAIGQGKDYTYPDFLRTLKKDPDIVPVLKFKAGGADFINVGWELPSVEVEDHVHFYELELTNNTTRLNTISIQSADSQNMFVFDKLSSATTYLIRDQSGSPAFNNFKADNLRIGNFIECANYSPREVVFPKYQHKRSSWTKRMRSEGDETREKYQGGVGL